MSCASLEVVNEYDGSIQRCPVSVGGDRDDDPDPIAL